MNDNQTIGVNLRMLRKIHHETQEELGEILGLSKSAICAYEKGERALDTQKLQLYANHYRKSIDELVHGNLTSLNSMQYFKSGKAQMKIMLDAMYPRAYSEEAAKDEYFKIAYEKHTKICEALYEMEKPSKLLVDQCWEAYTEALEKSEIVEAAVNLLGIILICWSSIADEQQEEIGNTIKKSGKKPIETKKLLPAGDSIISSEIEKLRETFLERFDEMTMGLIAITKATEEWAECGDFYLAMKYMVGMQDNYLSLEMNLQIGIQLMCSLFELENPYAVSFLLGQDKLIES